MPGMKRPLSESEGAVTQDGAKRQKIVHHKIRHTQPGLPEQLPLEDSAFYGSQLIRSISVGLKAAGFDSVTKAALEAFRAETEEYMLHFCSHIRQSMSSARRIQAIPSDFIHALAHHRLEPHDLLPQLKTGIPPSVTLPPIPPPLPEVPQPPDLEAILGPELSGAAEKAKRKYVPKHFPNFPDTSTWKATPAYVDRETDPQKLREKANEEGIQAEKALRELMAAAKSSKQKNRKGKKSLQREAIWKYTFDELSKEDEKRRKEVDKARSQAHDEFAFNFGGDGAMDLIEDASPKKQRRLDDLKIEGPVMVNYESKYWRKSAQRSA